MLIFSSFSDTILTQLLSRLVAWNRSTSMKLWKWSERWYSRDLKQVSSLKSKKNIDLMTNKVYPLLTVHYTH